MTESFDVIVVGAGVVGLAVARALALQGYEVVVVERHCKIGQETSSRNSGVIHSGIYYATDSLKAKLCVRGRHLLYDYCDVNGIPYQRCGKLIVAQETQVTELQSLHKKGIENGVHDLGWLTQAETAILEPTVKCAAALLSPSTGIIDVHALMNTLHGEIEIHQGNVVFRTEIVTVRSQGDHLQVTISNQNEISVVTCRHLINSAGLSALDLLRKIKGYPSNRLRQSHFAKGNYFSCQGITPFRHLVYPMPTEAGLGVHATLDLDGSTRFGPDVEWVSTVDDYQVNTKRALPFYAAIREYWPGLPDDALQPAYSGIRPKLVGPEEKASDFVIEDPNQHGIPGLFNLLGIESPGLTSSMAIGEYVTKIISSA